jgi:hypothetical protein
MLKRKSDQAERSNLAAYQTRRACFSFGQIAKATQLGTTA